MGGDGAVDLSAVAEIAKVTAHSVGLEDLARPFLDVLQDVTGFESTYLTVLHWEDFKQEVRYARNSGDLEVGEGVFVDWSDTLCRRALLEGRTATDDVPTVWPDSDAAAEMGIVSYVSVPVVTSDGSTFGTLCAASARHVRLGDDERRVMELLATLLAHQVERERQRAAERGRVAQAAAHAEAKVVAVASAEHKLKTPLTVIVAAAYRLGAEVGLDDRERRDLVDAIGRQAGVLTACVEELLASSRSAGTAAPPLELDTVILEPLLVRVVADQRLLAEDRIITVSCQDRLSCLANQDALTHALEHVLDNALKYTPAGSPVDVAAEAHDGAVLVTVSDHGDGFDGDALIGAFSRGDDSDAIDGSGLGLHIVQSLVKAVGGSVEVARSPAGGAEVRLRLQADPGVS